MKIVLANVGFQYRNRDAETLTVLKRIDTTISAGEFVCIVGPSGCGKSTLLNIIAGFLKPTSGRLQLFDVTGRRTPPIAMVFQEYALFPWRKVIDNVCFGQEMAGVGKSARYEMARRYLALVGLEEHQHYYPHQLSGGMKQRVAIARALANEPDVLLMDEPLGSLDAQTRVILQRELVRIWQQTGKTVIYVTHSIDEAAYLGDRVLVLSLKPTEIRKEIAIDVPRPRPEAAMIPYKKSIWEQIDAEIGDEL